MRRAGVGGLIAAARAVAAAQRAAFRMDEWSTVAGRAAGDGGDAAEEWGRRAAARLRADAADMAAVADRDARDGRFGPAAAAAAR